MFRGVDELRARRRVGPQLELGDSSQLSPHQVIDIGGIEVLLVEGILERLRREELSARHLEIQARLYGGSRAVRGTPIGHHQAGEAPLVLEGLSEQTRVFASIESVDAVVRA